MPIVFSIPDYTHYLLGQQRHGAVSSPRVPLLEFCSLFSMLSLQGLELSRMTGRKATPIRKILREQSLVSSSATNIDCKRLASALRAPELRSSDASICC